MFEAKLRAVGADIERLRTPVTATLVQEAESLVEPV
jgi:hypothetical protein